MRNYHLMVTCVDGKNRVAMCPFIAKPCTDSCPSFVELSNKDLPISERVFACSQFSLDLGERTYINPIRVSDF